MTTIEDDVNDIMGYARSTEREARYWQARAYEAEYHQSAPRRQSRCNPHSEYPAAPLPPRNDSLRQIMLYVCVAIAALIVAILAGVVVPSTWLEAPTVTTETQPTAAAPRATAAVVIQPAPAQQNVQIQWQPTDVPVVVEQPQPEQVQAQPTTAPVVVEQPAAAVVEPTPYPTLVTSGGEGGWYGGGASWADVTPEPTQQSITSAIVNAVVSTPEPTAQPEPTNADGWGGGGASWADYTPVADSGWGGGSSK